jgi:hypothetical protein
VSMLYSVGIVVWLVLVAVAVAVAIIISVLILNMSKQRGGNRGDSPSRRRPVSCLALHLVDTPFEKRPCSA